MFRGSHHSAMKWAEERVSARVSIHFRNIISDKIQSGSAFTNCQPIKKFLHFLHHSNIHRGKTCKPNQYSHLHSSSSLICISTSSSRWSWGRCGLFMGYIFCLTLPSVFHPLPVIYPYLCLYLFHALSMQALPLELLPLHHSTVCQPSTGRGMEEVRYHFG